MSKFMNGLNNDIPSPVEEGVVDSIKNFFGRNKAITVNTSAIKSDINSALQQITSLAKTSEFKKLAKGLYKVSSGSMEVYDEHYKTIGDLNDKRFSEIPIKAGQELHVNIGEIQFWKIFPNKDRLDRNPGAERGDLSPEGKEFDKIVDEFSKALDEKVKSNKYKISIEWLVDWDDNNYDIVFKFVPRNYIKNDGGIKESFSSVLDKEAVQEELFPILTGKELPVEEGIMSTIKTGLAGAAFFGTGLALWGIPIYLGYKAINKLSDKWEKDRMDKQNKAIEEKEKLIKKEAENSPFYDERSAAFKEASKIITKLFVTKFKDKNWLDPEPRADYFFLAGRTNMTLVGFVPSTIKWTHGIPGEDEYIAKLKKSGKYDYDELDENGFDYNLEPYYDEYNKFLDKLESDTNKKLSKLFGGKFGVLISDNHNIEEFASDDYDYPGLVLLIDKSRIKNGEKFIDFYDIDNFLRESTEVVSEDAFTKVAALAIIGGLMFKGYKDKKKNLEEAEKREAEARAKEIAEYAKQSDYMTKHPVNTKERKAVLAEAKRLLSNKNFNFYKSRYFEQYGDEKIFTGESKDADVLNICCIDLCGLAHPDQYEDMDPDEWWHDLTAEISAANKELHKKFNKRYVLEEEDYTILLVDTVYKAGLLNAVKENYTPFMDTYTAALEGWGIAFTRFAVKHNLPFATKLEDKIWEWSESTVNQLTNIPEFKEYILREAPKAYDEAYLRNNNLSINVNADMISEFEEEYEDSEAYHKVDKKNCCFCKKIGKFYVGVFGDKSHIHGVWLLMSDSKNKKIYAKALPAPEKELNKFKYQK